MLGFLLPIGNKQTDGRDQNDQRDDDRENVSSGVLGRADVSAAGSD